MTLCRVGEDQDVDFAGRHGDRSYCVFVGLGDVMDLREREDGGGLGFGGRETRSWWKSRNRSYIFGGCPSSLSDHSIFWSREVSKYLSLRFFFEENI